MISKVVKQEIKRLLERGELFHREVAKRVGVSRQTVTRMSRRGPVGMIKEATKEGLGKCLVETEEEVIGGKRNRCSTCGAMVYGECYECRLKKAKRNGELPQTYVGSGESLDLCLTKEETERLEELREVIQLELAEDDE